MDRPFDRFYPQSQPISVCPNCEQEYKGSPDLLTCSCGKVGCEECFTMCDEMCDDCFEVVDEDDD